MKKPIVFIDIETTGLNPEMHEIIEIACLRIDSGGHRSVYYAKVHPMRIEIAHHRALEINGYNGKDWREAFFPNEVAAQLESFLSGALLVGHNIKFDVSFISELMHAHKRLQTWDRRLIDTIVLAHEHLSPCGIESLSLDSIRSFLGWTHEGSHRAMRDAQDVMRLYKTLSRCSGAIRFYWTIKHKILKLLGRR